MSGGNLVAAHHPGAESLFVSASLEYCRSLPVDATAGADLGHLEVGIIALICGVYHRDLMWHIPGGVCVLPAPFLDEIHNGLCILGHRLELNFRAGSSLLAVTWDDDLGIVRGYSSAADEETAGDPNTDLNPMPTVKLRISDLRN